MFDKKFLLKNKDEFEQSLKKRGVISDFFVFEANYNDLKKIISEQEKLRADQKKIKTNNEQAVELKKQIVKLSELKDDLEKKINNWILHQPNILKDSVPIGESEKCNKVVFTSEFEKKDSVPHYELIENLILKNEAASLSGSRFVVLKKELSNLKNALVQFMLELNQKAGYEEYSIPCLVNESSLYGTGQLPKFAKDAFKTTENKWLISTGEIGLVNIFKDYVFQNNELPKLCMTFSPCFRSEAGSAGKDTKGLIRLHQFHKVELVTICKKADAENMHKKKLEAAENILKKLKLPYRIVLICSADTGFTATKQYDIEVWMPGMKRWVEIASCSQCGDFQAIRANIRCKTEKGLEYVHTLNGSALPIERLIAAIVENYYSKEDSSINIPEELLSYSKQNKIKINS